MTQEQEQANGERDLAERFRGYLPVVIDIETGGFNAASDAMLEIAAVTVRMDEQGYLHRDQEFSAAVEPFAGANIDKASLEFTGIDLQDPTRDARPENEVMTDMLQMIRKCVKAQHCKRAIMVAHNAAFDHSFLFAAAERNAIKRNPFHPFSTFDTVSFAGLAFGQTVLARACHAAGLGFDNASAHSAAYDAGKTTDLFCFIVNRWKDSGGWDTSLEDLPAQF